MKKLFLLAAVALAACSKEHATVALDKSNTDNLPMDIVIDDSIKIHLVSDTSLDLRLLVGEHVLKAKGLSKTFEVEKEGGIINLDNTEYVLYGIEYATGKTNIFGGMHSELPILIDSFIVFKNREVLGKKVPVSDKSLLEKLPMIEKNVSAPGEKGKAHFTKVGKDQFYIPKFWDYNLNDEIPETIEIKGPSGIVKKYAAMRARYFLFSLYLGNTEYSARTIADVKAGLFDREQEMAQDSIPSEESIPVKESN